MDTFVCQTCSKPFESKVTRRFCSVRCRARAPEFRKAILANLRSARANYVPPPKTGETRPCAHCGNPFYLTKTMIKRGAKTCSRVCYRAWMAARFDRFVGHVENLNEIKGFDEYLSGRKLKCLVEGCGWEGHHMANHANQAHGIKAETLKAAVGFNKGTALISSTLAKALREREHAESRYAIESAREHCNRLGAVQETRREALEHHGKAAEVRRLFKSVMEEIDNDR